MAAFSTNPINRLYKGKGSIFFKKDGETGKHHFGEVTVFSNTPEISKTPFKTSLNSSGTVYEEIDETNYTGTMTYLEMTVYNIALAMLSSDIVVGAQTVGTLDGVATTTISGKFVSLGKAYTYYKKLVLGAVGTLAIGETVTSDGTGTPTGKIVWIGDDYIEVISTTGNATDFAAGDTITGGTSTETAVISQSLTVSGAIVTDAATATVRYVKNTDYDYYATSGDLGENPDGSIAANTVYVSCDYKAKVTKQVTPLAESITQGEMWFEGDTDYGRHFKIWYPKVNLVADGEMGWIGEEKAEPAIAITILSDASTYPDTPYGTITEWTDPV